MTPHVALAVLNRALADACDIIHDLGRGRPTRAAAVAEARAFWESDEPEWREARQAWCDAAGVNLEKARAIALQEIAKAGAAPTDVARYSRSELVRRDFAAGVPVTALVERYGLSRSGIYKALSRKSGRWA